MNATNKFIGEKIAEFCAENKAQKKALCKELNIDQAELEAYIDGEREIHCLHLYQIADYLDKDVAAFYPEEGAVTEDKKAAKRVVKNV